MSDNKVNWGYPHSVTVEEELRQNLQKERFVKNSNLEMSRKDCVTNFYITGVKFGEL